MKVGLYFLSLPELDDIPNMKTKCQVCESRFSASEALCDDWKDPERSFGCPQCGTFYVKDLKPDTKAGAVAGCFGGGVGTASIMLLAHGLKVSDDKVVLLSIVIIFFGLVGAAIAFSRPRHELSRSPYRGDAATASEITA